MNDAKIKRLNLLAVASMTSRTIDAGGKSIAKTDILAMMNIKEVRAFQQLSPESC
jgi:hypothetical protein